MRPDRSAASAGVGTISANTRRRLNITRPALTIRQSLGISRDLAQTLTAIALVQTEMGEANLALDAYQQSLPLARASGDKTMYAFTLSSMAWLHIKLDEHQRAINLLQESLALFRETGTILASPGRST